MNVQGVNNKLNSLSQIMPQSMESKSNTEQQNSMHETGAKIEKSVPIDKKEADDKGSIDEKKVINAIEKANQKIQGNDKEFQYSVHEVTKQIMVKVIDRQSGKVINEFPPEKILDMVAKMWETAGLLVDEKR